MSIKLIIVPEVEQDINEAYAWYESQKRGLGESFYVVLMLLLKIFCACRTCIQSFMKTTAGG